MKNQYVFFLLLLLLAVGCQAPKAVYLFSPSQNISYSANKLNGPLSKAMEVKTYKIHYHSILFSDSAGKKRKKNFDLHARNEALKNFSKRNLILSNSNQNQALNSLQPAFLSLLKKDNSEVAKVIAKTTSVDKKSIYQRIKARLDPSPQSFDAALVFLLMLLLTVIAIILGIAIGWWGWYIIALGLLVLAGKLDNLIMNPDRRRIFASDYIKAILVVALLTTAVIFAIKYILLLSSFYIILLISSLVLAFFIWQIIRYYKKQKSENAR